MRTLVKLSPGSGINEATQRDEHSDFSTKGGADNAQLVYDTLTSSSISRFPLIRRIGIIISFPRKQVGDFTLIKYAEAKDDPRMFVDRGATWDFHPMFDPAHKLYKNIPFVLIEELNIMVPAPYEKAFRTDGAGAMTRFMAQPPLTEGGFFENPQAIDQAVNKNLPVIRTSEHIRENMNTDTGTLRRFVALEMDYLPPRMEGAIYFAHGDPGLVKDAFSVAVCHTEGEMRQVKDIKGNMVPLKMTVLDFVISWVPKVNRPVDLLNQEAVMLQLIEYYGIKRVTFDKWNSAHSVQKLQDLGIDAEDMSFSNSQQLEMYRHLRLLIYAGMLEIPSEHEDCLNELKFLQLKGEKLIHDQYGKDRADAIAAAVWNAAGRGSRVISFWKDSTQPGSRFEGIFVRSCDRRSAFLHAKFPGSFPDLSPGQRPSLPVNVSRY